MDLLRKEDIEVGMVVVGDAVPSASDIGEGESLLVERDGRVLINTGSALAEVDLPEGEAARLVRCGDIFWMSGGGKCERIISEN